MKQLPDDFRDFLQLLNDSGVEYLIVGGWALGIHGHIRATADMDVWIATTPQNVAKLQTALERFGVPKGTPDSFFTAPGNAFRMGSPPLRIEVITSASGVEFGVCYSRRVTMECDGVPVPFICLEDFVQNKTSSGRFKDMADLEAIGRLPGKT